MASIFGRPLLILSLGKTSGIESAVTAITRASKLFKSSESFWIDIDGDCLAASQKETLFARPLFLDIASKEASFPSAKKLYESLASYGAPWPLIAAWYDQVCENASVDPFPTKALDALANESIDFWGDGKGNSRTLDIIMADIAERLGWGGETRRESPLPSESSEVPKTADVTPTATVERAMGQLQRNSGSIALTLAAVTIEIDRFRETVRGKNTIEEVERTRLNAILDALQTQIEEMKATLQKVSEGEVSPEQAENAANWWSRFSAQLKQIGAKYIAPENIAEVSFPAGIVISGATIGGLLGAPLPGALIGGFLANQMRPTDVAKELFKDDGIDPET